jgi:hypothetical protein
VAGAVAHRRGAVLVVDGEPAVERLRRGQQLLVAEHTLGHRVLDAVVDHHDAPDRGQPFAQRPEHRQQ